MRKHLFQCYYLVFAIMASIIQDYINNRMVFFKLLPEFPIRLVTDNNFDIVLFIHLAGFFYIHSIDMTFVSEIVFPHPQATTTVYANFQNMNFLTDVFL